MDEKSKKSLHDNIKDRLLGMIKDAKTEKGAVIGEDVVEAMLVTIKGMEDDALILRMTESFGQAASLIRNPGDVFKVYGLLLAYYHMEKEAQERELYW